MWHHHSHWSDQSSRNIGIAFWLNSLFVVIEIVWWLYTNSMSIVSDALHDLGDSLALGIAWLVARYSTKKANAIHSYGYKWYSLLSALLLWIILIIWSCTIIYHSIFRLLNPEVVNSMWMIWLAIFGIIVNGIGAYRVHTWSTQNEKIISWHLLEDMLWRIAVLFWAVIIYYTWRYIVDPLFALGYSLYILYHGIQNIYETTTLLTQWTPAWIDIVQLQSQIESLQWVINIHDIHCRSLDGENNIFTAHIVVDWTKDVIIIKQGIKQLLDQNHHIHHSTLEFEHSNEQCQWWCD